MFNELKNVFCSSSVDQLLKSVSPIELNNTLSLLKASDFPSRFFECHPQFRKQANMELTPIFDQGICREGAEILLFLITHIFKAIVCFSIAN